MTKLDMKKYNMILTEKQQKILALSSGTIDKYEILTGEEILPSDEVRIIGQAKFAYSPLGKAFKRQENIEDQVIKQVKALEALKSEENKQKTKSIEGIFQRTNNMRTKNMTHQD